MSKRTQKIADKLEKDSQPPGWQDHIQKKGAPQDEAPKKPTTKRKTYLLTPELIERIEQIAQQKQVGINELVRFLLVHSLTQLDQEAMSLPMEAETVYRIKS